MNKDFYKEKTNRIIILNTNNNKNKTIITKKTTIKHNKLGFNKILKSNQKSLTLFPYIVIGSKIQVINAIENANIIIGRTKPKIFFINIIKPFTYSQLNIF